MATLLRDNFQDYITYRATLFSWKNERHYFPYRATLFCANKIINVTNVTNYKLLQVTNVRVHDDDNNNNYYYFTSPGIIIEKKYK